MNIARAKYVVIGLTLAGALCVAGMLAYLILPTYRDLYDLANQLTTTEDEIQAQYASRKQLSDTINRLQAARMSIAKLSKQFVVPGDELSVIKAFEDLGDRDGVVTHFQLTGDTANKDFDRGFSLTITGAFRPVTNALVDLERMQMITTIQSITIRGNANDVSVNLSGFFASPPKESPPK